MSEPNYTVKVEKLTSCSWAMSIFIQEFQRNGSSSPKHIYTCIIFSNNRITIFLNSMEDDMRNIVCFLVNFPSNDSEVPSNNMSNMLSYFFSLLCVFSPLQLLSTIHYC